jgi:hypothetical protein
MTKLCARGKSAAKRKFKVYPSAYANAYASKICAGKAKDPSGVKRKDWGPKKMNDGGYFDEQKTNVKGKNKTGPIRGGKTPQIPGGEYMKYKKLKKNKVVSAKVGKAVTAGSQSAIGRLEKSGLKMRGGGIAIKGTDFKGVF